MFYAERYCKFCSANSVTELEAGDTLSSLRPDSLFTACIRLFEDQLGSFRLKSLTRGFLKVADRDTVATFVSPMIMYLNT